MKLDDRGAARLAVAIIEQAIIDYVEEAQTGGGVSMRGECMTFFRSNWCTNLLDMAGVEWNNEYLIRLVKEKAEKEENKKGVKQT